MLSAVTQIITANVEEFRLDKRAGQKNPTKSLSGTIKETKT